MILCRRHALDAIGSDEWLFAVDFLELVQQFLATQVGSHNLALGVNEHIARNRAYAIDLVGSTLPALEV